MVCPSYNYHHSKTSMYITLLHKKSIKIDPRKCLKITVEIQIFIVHIQINTLLFLYLCCTCGTKRNIMQLSTPVRPQFLLTVKIGVNLITKIQQRERKNSIKLILVRLFSKCKKRQKASRQNNSTIRKQQSANIK